jgi:hypothetical protein
MFLKGVLGNHCLRDNQHQVAINRRTQISVGAAAGCDLLLFSDSSAIKIKRSQASPAPTPDRGVP